MIINAASLTRLVYIFFLLPFFLSLRVLENNVIARQHHGSPRTIDRDPRKFQFEQSNTRQLCRSIFFSPPLPFPLPPHPAPLLFDTREPRRICIAANADSLSGIHWNNNQQVLLVLPMLHYVFCLCSFLQFSPLSFANVPRQIVSKYRDAVHASPVSRCDESSLADTALGKSSSRALLFTHSLLFRPPQQ